MIVAIDPGHGGDDPGAVGPGGEREADINWAVAVAVGAVLETRGDEVVFTRQHQLATVGLKERVDVANDAEVDAVVSIHCNSAEQCPERDEARVYYFRGSERGRRLAVGVIEAFQRRGLPVSSEPRGRGFYVLRFTRAPAVLVELGFVCSVEGAERLMGAAGQLKAGIGIAEGVSLQITRSRACTQKPSRVGLVTSAVPAKLPLGNR